MADDKKDFESVCIVPMLYLKDLSAAIEFYTKAFGASVRWKITNPDETVHVAELTIPPTIFRLHEEVSGNHHLSPLTLQGTPVVVGLLVEDPDQVAKQAVIAGATEVSPVKDYEYGYRQGSIVDPFGHHWCLEKIDSLKKVPAMGT